MVLAVLVQSAFGESKLGLIFELCKFRLYLEQIQMGVTNKEQTFPIGATNIKGKKIQTKIQTNVKDRQM